VDTRIVPPPTEIPADTSPYIAASIRQSQLEREQQLALTRVLNEMGVPPEWRESILHTHRRKAKMERANGRRRARLSNVPFEDFTRAEIIRRDGRRCYLCKRDALTDAEIHIDHRVPIARGGAHTRANVAVACADCNTRKSTLTDSEEFLASRGSMR